MKIAAYKDLSNNLKSIMLMLGFILGKLKKISQVALLLIFLEKTYKSSDYSTTFIASRMAWLAKERDNAKKFAFGVLLR